MGDLVDSLTRGNPGSVKSVLSSVVFALAAPRRALPARARRVRVRPPGADLAHRRAALPGRGGLMTRQLIASVLVALAIVAVTIAVVTARLGPSAEDHHHGGGTEQHGGHGED
jgi:hypothetical protein